MAYSALTPINLILDITFASKFIESGSQRVAASGLFPGLVIDAIRLPLVSYVSTVRSAMEA
jgi:hypothetical protein